MDATPATTGLPDDPRDLRRDHFPVLWPIATRWRDDDSYRHLNNVVSYEMFDTVVNGWLMRACGTDIRELPAVGLVVETSCRYLSELRFPETVTAGLSVAAVGRSSVTYRLALFGESSEEPAAVGRFVHVYVDVGTRRPVPFPAEIRAAFASVGAPADGGGVTRTAQSRLRRPQSGAGAPMTDTGT